MKKFLAIIISLLTICTAFLSGCSCVPSGNPLEFNNLAVSGSGSQKLDQNTIEKHTYSVNLNTDYSQSMKLDDFLKTSPVSIQPQNFNGTCVVEISYKPYTSATIENASDDKVKNNSVLNALLRKGGTVNVYTYVTTLNLNVNYDFGETQIDGSEHLDTIKTTTYFVGQEGLYVPLYNKIENYCNHLAYQNSQFGIMNVYYDSETVYSSSTYSNKTTYYNKQMQQSNQTSFTAKYENGKVYDASSLLFISRNVIIPSDSYQIIAFASPSYNKPTEIRFEDKGQTTFAPGFELRVNAFSENYTKNTGADVPVNKISYYINDVRMTGVSQELFIQRADAGEVKNRGYLVKYVAPMMTYGGTSMMLGGLEYNLTNVEIINK